MHSETSLEAGAVFGLAKQGVVRRFDFKSRIESAFVLNKESKDLLDF
jgi:hypothetical protein